MQTADGNQRQIAVLGPTRMDYKRVKGLLELFKEEIERGAKGAADEKPAGGR